MKKTPTTYMGCLQTSALVFEYLSLNREILTILYHVMNPTEMVEKPVLAFSKPVKADCPLLEHDPLTQPMGPLTFNSDAASRQSLGWLYCLCVLFDLI